MTFRISPLALFAVILAAACSGGDGLPTGGSQLQVVSSILISPDSPQLEPGLSVTLSAFARDKAGTSISGKTATWTSSNTAVATVDAGGVVQALQVGSTLITATVDGKSGTAGVVVSPPSVASIAVTSAGPASVVAGQSVSLSAALKDRNGQPVGIRSVLWKSSNTRVASVDQQGNVTGLSSGTSAITAAVDNVTGTFTILVTPPAGAVAPSVSSVAPSTLTPGITGTITGTNFVTPANLNQVYIAGQQAPITSASATQITFTVPATLPCQSTQLVDVEVTTVGGTSGIKRTLQIATQRSMGVGQNILLTAGSLSCNELPANGTYLVSVFNAGKTLSATSSFELTGAAGGTLADKLTTPGALSSSILLAPSTSRSSTTSVESAAASEHLQQLNSDLALVRTLGAPSRSRGGVSRSVSGTSAGATSAAMIGVPTTVGAMATLNYHFNSCRQSSATPVTARVVYVGSHVIVLEDNASPLAGKIDADMVGLAREFEEVSYPILTKNFGDPVAFDASTDNNGRIIMFFTPQVNSSGSNLLGFVAACDLYRPTDDVSVSASNQAEIFYARAVTDTTSTSNTLDSRAQWKRQMPSTLIHETKHIISFAERFQTPVLITAYEETWLEEATAQDASELYGRAIHGNTWRGNAGYTGTLDCEIRPSTASCNGGIFVMGNHFGFLSEFLQGIEGKTILSGTDDNDIYGSSWMFTRWLIDNYGGADEAAFIKSLVLNYNVTGVNNVTAVTGKTWPQLLSQFTLMLAADDLAGIDAPFIEQSWNLPAVFTGYNVDLPSSRVAQPLKPRTANFGSNFSASIGALKGGGAMLLRINGTSSGSTTQLLDLHAVTGAALPASTNIGISVLRVQ